MNETEATRPLHEQILAAEKLRKSDSKTDEELLPTEDDTKSSLPESHGRTRQRNQRLNALNKQIPARVIIRFG